MISFEDFTYILKRLDRDLDSPTGQALKLMLVHGKIMAQAINACGVPAVRLSPVYEQAKRIVSALRVSEADGFTAEEVAVANRALAWARAKEMEYSPTPNDFHAMEAINKMGGSACKAMDSSTDDLPGIPLKTLNVLHRAGLLDCQPMQMPNLRWSLTEKARTALAERYSKK